MALPPDVETVKQIDWASIDALSDPGCKEEADEEKGSRQKKCGSECACEKEGRSQKEARQKKDSRCEEKGSCKEKGSGEKESGGEEEVLAAILAYLVWCAVLLV